jgi:molecular chaperone GrpE (heat shock protein)
MNEKSKPGSSPLAAVLDDWRDRHVDQLKEMHRLRVRLRQLESDRYDELCGFLLSVIEVLDSFDRTAAAIGRALTDEDKKARRVQDSYKSLRRQLAAALKNFGVSPMGAAAGAEFVAGLHKAAGLVFTEEVPEGRIVSVEKDGYFWDDRILRTADVIVSSEEAETLDEEA